MDRPRLGRGPPLPDNIDDLVWHYTDGHGLISILTGHCLWATSSAFLNDRQEIAYGGALIARRIRELPPEDPTGILESLAQKVDTATTAGNGPGASNAYILSASRSPDSQVKWRWEPWQPVRYTEEAQLALVDPLVTGMPKRLVELQDDMKRMKTGEAVFGETRAAIDQYLDDLQEALFLIKHPGFVDEREARFGVGFATGAHGHPDPETEADLLTYRPRSYGIAPYLRLTGADSVGEGVAAQPNPLPVRAVAPPARSDCSLSLPGRALPPPLPPRPPAATAAARAASSATTTTPTSAGRGPTTAPRCATTGRASRTATSSRVLAQGRAAASRTTPAATGTAPART